jgi:hypothetical protein
MTNIMAYVKNDGPIKSRTLWDSINKKNKKVKKEISQANDDFLKFWSLSEENSEIENIAESSDDLNFSAFNQKIGVVMADSLGSTPYEKKGGYQKLFDVYGNYVLGTGRLFNTSLVINKLFEKFKDAGKISPFEISETIIALVDKLFASLRKEEGLNFIVVGEEENKLSSYKVMLPDVRIPLLGSGLILDGSGSEFVGKARERDAQRGLLLGEQKYDTIADLALSLFDLAYVATRSSGVNDEFQFGFILPEGNATIFHPNVCLDYPAKEYSDATGRFDENKNRENSKTFADFHKKLNEGRLIQYYCNINTAYLTSSSPFDKTMLLDGLSKLSKDFDKVRKELNQMIFNYVLKHNKKQ